MNRSHTNRFLGMLTIFAALQQNEAALQQNEAALQQNELTPSSKGMRYKKEVLPKGCNRYYFLYGEIVSSEYSEICDFTCVAINEKYAKRKYEKFINKGTF